MSKAAAERISGAAKLIAAPGSAMATASILGAPCVPVWARTTVWVPSPTVTVKLWLAQVLQSPVFVSDRVCAAPPSTLSEIGRLCPSEPFA